MEMFRRNEIRDLAYEITMDVLFTILSVDFPYLLRYYTLVLLVRVTNTMTYNIYNDV
jgi:hypothetical protein